MMGEISTAAFAGIVVAGSAAAFAGVLSWGQAGLGVDGAAVASVVQETRSFPICNGPLRTTCVVDGDTIWMGGVKIRIADIDTPESVNRSARANAPLVTERKTGFASC